MQKRSEIDCTNRQAALSVICQEACLFPYTRKDSNIICIECGSSGGLEISLASVSPIEKKYDILQGLFPAHRICWDCFTKFKLFPALTPKFLVELQRLGFWAD